MTGEIGCACVESTMTDEMGCVCVEEDELSCREFAELMWQMKQ